MPCYVSCKGKTTKNENHLNDNIKEHVNEEYSTNDDAHFTDVPVTYHYIFKGKIDGKYAFSMSLTVDSTSVSGQYQYANSKDYGMSLSGSIQNNDIKLEETLYIPEKQKSETTGFFEGKFYPAEGKVSGTWFSANRGKSYPFEMNNYYGVNYPQFSFKSDIQGDDIDKTLNTLVIYDKNGKIQTIENIGAKPTYNGLIMQDFNFDGYLDIALMEMLGMRFTPYIYFAYNPNNKQFEKMELSGDIDSKSFDYENKIMTSGWYYGSDRYGNSSYKYNNGKFYEISSLQHEENDDTGEYTETTTNYKIINGESVVDSEAITESRLIENTTNEFRTITIYYKIIDNEKIEDKKLIEETRLKKGSTEEYIKTRTWYKKAGDEWVNETEE